MKPPFRIAGQYPQNWIQDSTGADVVTSIAVSADCDEDMMQLLCDALNANSDPTMRMVQIPAEMFPLPELPEGKSRWIGRGTFKGYDSGILPNRQIRYWDATDNEWLGTQYFGSWEFHIEAI
jgi:methyl coenzyme M reductase gamma subunit